jgi:hypothetical protein
MLSTIQYTLSELSYVIGQLDDVEYSKPLGVLNNVSIGQHTRHSIEMFQCLFDGYESGRFSYDNRPRNVELETDRAFAQLQLQIICSNLDLVNKQLISSNKLGTSHVQIETNFYRELLFNLEHCIHHNALIRIGINSFSVIEMSENFGVAPSTIEYRKTCVF